MVLCDVAQTAADRANALAAEGAAQVAALTEKYGIIGNAYAVDGNAGKAGRITMAQLKDKSMEELQEMLKTADDRGRKLIKTVMAKQGGATLYNAASTAAALEEYKELMTSTKGGFGGALGAGFKALSEAKKELAHANKAKKPDEHKIGLANMHVTTCVEAIDLCTKKYGDMNKKGGKDGKKGSKHRIFALVQYSGDTDTVIATEKEDIPASPGSWSLRYYDPKKPGDALGVVTLDASSVVEKGNKEKDGFAWHVTGADGRKYFFAVATEELSAEWIAAVEEVIASAPATEAAGVVATTNEEEADDAAELEPSGEMPGADLEVDSGDVYGDVAAPEPAEQPAEEPAGDEDDDLE